MSWLGWLDNQQDISCIPEGKYPLKYEYSPRFKMNLWEIKQVPNRSECKFHSANYWYELNGCIALGITQKDFNNDGFVDNQYSKDALSDFHQIMSLCASAELRVINSIL